MATHMCAPDMALDTVKPVFVRHLLQNMHPDSKTIVSQNYYISTESMHNKNKKYFYQKTGA